MHADSLYNDIMKNFIRPAFQRLPLSYCVSTADMYATICCVKCDMVSQESDEYTELDWEYGTQEAKEKCSKHLGRIIDKIAVSNDTDVPKLFRDTVFSACLRRKMVEEYNYIGEELGLVPVPKGYAGALRDRAWCSLSKSNKNKVAASLFAFPEFVLLACLCLSLRSSSVEVLNRPIDPEKQKGRAKARFKRIKDTLLSIEFRKAIAATFFDLLADYFTEQYRDVEEKHLRFFWLPPKYRTTRYLGNAEEYIYRQYDVENNSLSEPELHQYAQQRHTLDLMEHFFGCICPVAEMMVVGAIPMDLLDSIDVSVDEINVDAVGKNITMIDMRQNMVELHSTMEGVISKNEITCAYKVASQEDEKIDLIRYITESNVLSRNIQDHLKSAGSYEICKGEYIVASRIAMVIGAYIDRVIDDVVEMLGCLPETKGLSKEPFVVFFDKL